MENRNDRMIIKLAGSAGQGIKTAGLIIAKALKRAGYRVFGYTEYPSLIRGGHNVFQIEIYQSEGSPLSKESDIVLALDKTSVIDHQDEVPEGGVIIYDENSITIEPELLKEVNERKVELIGIKLLDLATGAGGNSLMKNTVAMGSIWAIMGLDVELLSPIIRETYNKSEEMINANLNCLKAGFENIKDKGFKFSSNIQTDPLNSSKMLISGNEAVALGAIAGGVRLYSSYPMTPASSILTYLAENGPKHGMIVKQAEDEITAANMVLGAYHSGTRSMCATSGGGFDLMTETMSLSGITETPFFCVIGQRPGPGTGVPTWTAQGDLDLALKSGHGEFPRIVLAPSDPMQAFELTIEALNLTEKFQTPVLMLLDKQLGESFYTTEELKSDSVKIDRGKILSKDLFTSSKGKLRYELTDDGISTRWFPGDQVETFYANSDEHTQKGYSTENAQEIEKMMNKRLKKYDAIKNAISDPIIYGDVTSSKLNLVSWGSNVEVIKNAINELKKQGMNIALMQIVYLWPLKTEAIINYIKGKKTAVIELNATSQLTRLIKAETGIEIENKFNKFDGRPFYTEEIIEYINKLLK